MSSVEIFVIAFCGSWALFMLLFIALIVWLEYRDRKRKPSGTIVH